MPGGGGFRARNCRANWASAARRSGRRSGNCATWATTSRPVRTSATGCQRAGPPARRRSVFAPGPTESWPGHPGLPANDLHQRHHRAAGAGGAGEGAVVFAESQSQGRGRLGRVWLSPAERGFGFRIAAARTSSQSATQLTVAAATALWPGPSRCKRASCRKSNGPTTF